MNSTEEQDSRRVIGMDIHPSCFSAAALCPGQEAADARVIWTHDGMAMERLEAWAETHLREHDIVVVEAGNSAFDVCLRLTQRGLHAVVLESYRVGQIADSYLKNDRNDAIKLARVYLSGLAKEVWQPDQTCREQREVLSLYQRAVRDTTRARNRITSWMTQHGVSRPRKSRMALKDSGTWLLKEKPWSDEQKILIEILYENLHHAEKIRGQLRRQIARTVVADKKLLKLVQLCGIRHITAYALGAVIGDISRFRTPKQLVAYIGLNPRVKESGTSKGGSRLAHNGRKDARAMVVQGAQALLRQDPRTYRLAKWGQQLLRRKSKNHAVIAVARKLVTAVWYVLSGFACNIVENSGSVALKLTKIAREIGLDQLREDGYESTRQFTEKKMAIIFGTA